MPPVKQNGIITKSATATTQLVKESPIVFSSQEEEAILKGKKTQTRQLVIPQPEKGLTDMGLGHFCENPGKPNSPYRLCPFVMLGDQLRVSGHLVLEITDVRADRLQDLSRKDIIAEGVQPKPNLQEGFRKMWEAAHGAISWRDNPWVWVIGFRRVH